MIPVFCRVKHDPSNGKYGDCLRAVVASMLEIEQIETVPHFFEDGCDGEIGCERLTQYLKTRRLNLYCGLYDESMTLVELLSYFAQTHPELHYILCGKTDNDVNHVVICKGGSIVHNPAWTGSHIKKPTENGWLIILLTVL